MAEHSLREAKGSLPVLVWPWCQVLQQTTLWRRKRPMRSGPLQPFPQFPHPSVSPSKTRYASPTVSQLPPAPLVKLPPDLPRGPMHFSEDNEQTSLCPDTHTRMGNALGTQKETGGDH